MSTVHYRDAYVWINGVDLSADCAEVSLEYAAEMLDETAFGDTTRIHKGGLFTWTLTLRVHQDFRSGGPDATLFPLVGTTTCWEIRPLNSCSTAINPRLSGIGILRTWPPQTGQVGTLLDATATFDSASNLTRSTTAT